MVMTYNQFHFDVPGLSPSKQVSRNCEGLSNNPGTLVKVFDKAFLTADGRALQTSPVNAYDLHQFLPAGK